MVRFGPYRCGLQSLIQVESSSLLNSATKSLVSGEMESG